MFNWLVIIAIFLVFMALKLTKFIGIAMVIALVAMLIVKNGFFRNSRDQKRH